MTFRWWQLLLVVFTHIGQLSAAEVPFRIPDGVEPLHYRLDLRIVPDEPRFSGLVEIDVRIASPVDQVWLHGQGLDVEEVALSTADGSTVTANYEQLNDDGMARVTFSTPVDPQIATLRFRYTAKFGSSLNGLYAVDVDDDAYAFTQFESIYARKVFPSFDEPKYKTSYDISITTREAYRAFTNTSVVRSKKLPDNMQRVTYATTLPLPTYLIAFAVGPLDLVEWAPVPASTVRAKPLPLRGIATRGQGPAIEYALANTAPLLLALEDYFGTAYPFDKLDVAAVPDFGAGAMENAGLITYREPLVLLGDNPAINQVRYYALVHAHELAHQWFGNLVTMPWWDDIWLNEAFASWIQARIGHQWDASFNFDRSTQARAIGAMQEDSLVSARQIRQPVNASADIVNAFDSITYQKGAGVLQMLENYLGPDTFRAALRTHMKTYALGNADVYDLMASLTKVAGADKRVEEIFESFLFKPGVPYLDVRPDCDDANIVRVNLAQQRYLPVGSAGNSEMTWSVPVCFAYGDAGNRYEQCAVVNEASTSIELEQAGCPAWIMPNANGAGYFRWRVSDRDFDALQAVFTTQLNARERISFADSLVAGLDSGDVAINTFFEILPTIIAARERAVVETPLRKLQQIVQMLDGGRGQPQRKLITQLLKTRLAQIDQPGGAESQAESTLLRAKLQRFLAVDLEDAGTRQGMNKALYRYLGYPKGTKPDAGALLPDLLRPALIVSVQDGDRSFLEFLLGRYITGASSRFRLGVMEALAYVDDPALADIAHEFVLTNDVRGNELDRWLDYSLKPSGYEFNWPWIRENLDRIFAKGSDGMQRESPYALGRWLCSRKDAALLEDIFEERVKAMPSIERNLARALEQIDLCIAFEAQHGTATAY